ncbi:interferon alpha-2-like [Dasypus novemcinctus]|uniref:interferon alpha-2-like n=1 Tax=Dasypus novemcinctus TaxID=9361 RepID=UPI00265F4D1B|nr:interferon alpha-2-like [Dasypus novemcinctus]
MALPVSVLKTLLMLCSIPACLGCDLPLIYGHQEPFMLLHQMGRLSILSCLKDRTDFQFPQELVDGNQLDKMHATTLLHEVVQQIFNLFSTSGSLATWDDTLLDRFLIGLHQQLDNLETCLGKEKEEDQTHLGSENSRLAVKRYFQGISQYLTEKQDSPCAWEVVRVEIRKCFLFINKLQGKLRK